MKPITIIAVTIAWMSLMFFGSSIPAISTTEITHLILNILNRLIDLLPDWLRGNSPISAESYSCFNMVIRKIGHFVEFQVLTVLLLKLLLSIKNIRHPYQKSGLIAIAFAFLDELYQSTVPNRSPLLLDVVVDTAGVLTVLVLVRLAASDRGRK
ncbi:MAG TPA: hypothetical protein DEF34_04815 [Desulfotomaculum sp.]|nr:hypothetical protein [Desulfotomaculum sp.]